METTSTWSAAMMSLRAAMASIILTALLSQTSMAPDGPDRVRWLGVFWLSVYAIAMIAQAGWLAWRVISNRHESSSKA
jgi:hypothetical protein